MKRPKSGRFRKQPDLVERHIKVYPIGNMERTEFGSILMVRKQPKLVPKYTCGREGVDKGQELTQEVLIRTFKSLSVYAVRVGGVISTYKSLL